MIILATLWLGGALLAGCAAPPAEVARQEPTPTLPATPAPSGAPLLLIGWDQTLGRVVRAVDPLTGADAAGYSPLPFAGERGDAYITPTGLAPDGRRLATFDVSGDFCFAYAGGSTCGGRSSAVYLVDVADWSIRRMPLAREGWVRQVAFSADGGRLAVTVQSGASAHTVQLIDAVAATTLGEVALPFAPSRLGFGPGLTLVVYGQAEGREAGISPPPPPRVLLLDATLTIAWEATLDDVVSGHWCVEQCDADFGVRKMTSIVPGVALSPDGAKLYVVHADVDRLTTVDLSGRTVSAVDIGAPTAWLDRLFALTAGVAHAKGPMDAFARYAVVSPDGARLYVSGYDFTMTTNDGGWDVAEEMQALRVLDLINGRILAERDAPNHTLRLTPDARLLLVDLSNNVTVTSVLDAETLATLAHVDGLDVQVTRDMKGQTRYVGQSIRHQRTTFKLLDPLTLEAIAEWPADGRAWLATE